MPKMLPTISPSPEVMPPAGVGTVMMNQTGFTGEQKARKVSYEQRKPREPFFD